MRKRSDLALHYALSKELGPGPMQFGPVRQEQPINEAIKTLTDKEVYAYSFIKIRWETEWKKEAARKKFPLEYILRCAILCNYKGDRAVNLLRKTNSRFVHLSAIDLSSQLQTKTLFPCPGMKTKQGYDVFYMRPSRYDPKKTHSSVIINNLVFVMDKINRKGDNQNKLAFVANMNGWTMANFSYDYCRKFMDALQGRVFAVKVDLFLIVDPPSWFDTVWSVMKPMLSADFRQKVRLIPRERLSEFLREDYEDFLPDDMEGGKVDTEDLVADFVTFHRAVEEKTHGPMEPSANLLQKLHMPPSLFGWRGSKDKAEDVTD